MAECLADLKMGDLVDTQSYYDSLPEKHVKPLWLELAKFVPPFPNPKASVAIWRYDTLRPALMKAGEIISTEEADRRVLMLVNPSMSAPCKCPTVVQGNAVGLIHMFRHHRQHLHRPAIGTSWRDSTGSSSRRFCPSIHHRGLWRLHSSGRREDHDAEGRCNTNSIVAMA